MLKLKLSQDYFNDKIIILDSDKRKSYAITDVKIISDFIYSSYSHYVNSILNYKGLKFIEIQNLNNLLIQEKNKLKILITALENSNINTYNYTKELYIMFIGNLDIWKTNTEKIDYLNNKLVSINCDISHINNIRKEFKRFFAYYENINLYYGNKAKITMYDLNQLDKNHITQNIKNCMVYYFTQYKKTKNLNLMSDDDSILINPFLTKQQINKGLMEIFKISYDDYLENRFIKNTNSILNNILTKYI